MEMRDKEFDQLFNSKLNDFEEEPSERVWENITAVLDEKKETKRSILPYLSIAASIVILAAASVLFFNRDVKTDNDEEVVKVVKETKPVKELSAAETNKAPLNETDDSEKLTHIAVTTPAVKKPSNILKESYTQPVNQQAKQDLAVPQPEQTLATTQTDKHILLPPAVTDNDVDINTATLVNQPKPIMEQPVTAIVDPIFESTKAKKRARGLGGLINTVIAAVDKRDDKLIEFTDSDNDEGTKVTAVNLGIFKIKKQ